MQGKVGGLNVREVGELNIRGGRWTESRGQ